MFFNYFGPGIGGGVLAIIAGLFLTFIAFIIAVFWLPIKRIYNWLAKKWK
jgi:uncharacterized membrane protein